MADSTISALNAILWSEIAAGDNFAVDDINAAETKKIAASELMKYILGNRTWGGTNAGDPVTIDGVQTLTNKKHTSPKINEDVACTATSTELNKMDGYTGNTNDLNTIAGIAAAGVTATELGYVNGVTSAIQTQINDLTVTQAIAYLNQVWCYAYSFIAVGTTETITATELLEGCGINADNYVIDPISINVEFTSSTSSPPRYTALSKDSTTYWDTVTSGGVTYLDDIVVTSLTDTNTYAVSVMFKLLNKPTGGA